MNEVGMYGFEKLEIQARENMSIYKKKLLFSPRLLLLSEKERAIHNTT